MPRTSEPPLFTKFYAIAKWLIERVEGFPKVIRFSLGERLLATALQVLEDITRAQFRREKAALLTDANERLDVLRVLVRLAMETKGLSFKQYEFVCGGLDEAGRMLGGWIAQQRRAAEPPARAPGP